MAIALRFNGEQFYTDLRERLVTVMDEINSEFFRTATSGMSSDAKSASEKDKAVLESTTDYSGDLQHSSADEEYINARCRFYTDAILESFGIGSLSDRGPYSQWEEYERSEFFNPSRKGKMNIVGRPAGTYTDIWGNTQESTGTREGQNLESKTGTTRKWYDKNGELHTLEPKRPTYKIQNAEVWLMQNRETSMERRIRTEVEKFFLELNANPLKYFYYVEV